MDDFEKYVDYKLIESIINCDNVLTLLDKYDELILNIKFVNVLNEFVLKNVTENLLDKKQLDNLLILINSIRLCKKMNSICNNTLNEMIIKINMSTSSNKKEYYLENFLDRFQRYGILRQIKMYSNYDEIIKKIKKSNSRDYFYLIMLTEADEDTFFKELNKFVLDEYILLSINKIIIEYPEILNNKTFLKRVLIISNSNLRELNKINEKNKKRIIEKTSLYYTHHIK